MRIIKAQTPIEVFENGNGDIAIKSEDFDGYEHIICIDPIHLKKFIKAIRDVASDIKYSNDIEAMNG